MEKYVNEDGEGAIPQNEEIGNLRLSEITHDKAELTARGKLSSDGMTGQFVYSLYDGRVSVICNGGAMEDKNTHIRDFIRRKVLESVFPLAGEAFIAELLEKEGTIIPMTNGFIQVNMEIQPSDVLLQLCDVTGHEQVFSRSGRLTLVKPMENGYMIMQEGRAPIYARTYSDVIRILGDDCKKIFEKSTIDKAKKRICKPTVISGLLDEQMQSRTI